MTPFWDTYVVLLAKLELRMVAFSFYIGSTYSTYAVFSPQQKTNIIKFGSFVNHTIPTGTSKVLLF